MTAQEIIEKIRAEIEQMLHSIENCPFISGELGAREKEMGEVMAYKNILSVLSDLEKECEEKPTNIDFEQELYKHFGQVKDFTLGMQIGKYFYELGCRRTAEKYDEIEHKRQRAEEETLNDLEEASQEYEKKHTYQRYDGGGFTPEYDATPGEAFIAGAQWQKAQSNKELSEKIAAAYQLGLADKEKQIMKEAVEGAVSAKFGTISIPHNIYEKYDGQKVKLIIVKEN